MSGYKLHNTPSSRDYYYMDRKTGSTALMYACCTARAEDALKIIEIFKNNYKYINARNFWGISALMYTAGFCSNTKIIDELVQCDVDINAEDKRGCTAIFWAIAANNIEVLKKLLSYKAQVNVLSKNGVSPISYTLTLQKPYAKEIVQLLIDYGATVQKDDFIFIAQRIENELKKNSHYLGKELEEQIKSVILSLNEGDKKNIIKTVNNSDLYLDSYDILSSLIDVDTRKKITILNFSKEQPTSLETDLETSKKYSEIIKKLKIEIDEFYNNFCFENNEIFIKIEKLIQTLEDGDINEIINVINDSDIFFEELIQISELFNFKDKIKKCFTYSTLSDIPHKKRNTENNSVLDLDFIKPKKYFKYKSIYNLLNGEQIKSKMFGC